jgi:hypothetical protein
MDNDVKQSGSGGIQISERNLPNNTIGKKRVGDLLQMVWGCFARNKLSLPIFIDENINADVYIRFSLSSGILSFLAEATRVRIFYPPFSCFSRDSYEKSIGKTRILYWIANLF